MSQEMEQLWNKGALIGWFRTFCGRDLATKSIRDGAYNTNL